jgi:hypothetical protein
MTASPLKLVPKDGSNVVRMSIDPATKVRRAIGRMEERLRTGLARGDRRGAHACATEAREALTAIGDLIAIVGLHLPVRCRLQDHIDKLLDVLEKARLVKGGL